MGLETTVNFISDLNPLNPTDGDLAKDGDNHIRLIKAAVKQTFPNITGAVTATQGELNKLSGLSTSSAELAFLVGAASNIQAQIDSLIPAGVILMWSGSIATIPSGWLLCNGANGTPDLRDRFVVGAGSTYAVSATGGAATITLTASQIPAHTHTFSATSGGISNHHNHNFHVAYQLGGGSFGVNGVSIAGASSPYLTTANYPAIPSQITGVENQDHTHNISGTTATNAGGGSEHENRPPYFALAYIMKA